jgi:hypothetical protein
LLEIKIFDNYVNRDTNLEIIKEKLHNFLNKKKTIVIKTIIRSVADKERTNIYKIRNESQIDEVLKEIGVEKSTIMATNLLPISKKYRFVFSKLEEKTKLLLCLQKKPLELREDGLKTDAETEVVVESIISENIKNMANDAFQALDIKLGSVDIIKFKDEKENQNIV